MEIRMTGASGYLGKLIATRLRKNGHKVSAINRELLYGPHKELCKKLKNSDVIINLAGAPVFQRWTPKNKKIILESRTVTVQNLVSAIQHLSPGQRPRKVVSASAIGIYASGETHSETSRHFDTGFPGEVVKGWEAAWNGLPKNTELTIFRIAVVLGRQSATIQKLLLPFRLGVGGKIGTGRQPFPFVHEKDVTEAFLWGMKNEKSAGTFNLVAPQQISNADFTQALAKKLNRPAFIPVPAFALKLLFGKAAGMLTKSPVVVPQKLQEAGFEFRYPTIEETVEEIFGQKH